MSRTHFASIFALHVALSRPSSFNLDLYSVALTNSSWLSSFSFFRLFFEAKKAYHRHCNLFLCFNSHVFSPISAGMLCILLWSLCVYKEYRSIWLGLEVVWRIPRSKRTDFRDNTFHSISKGAEKVTQFSTRMFPLDYQISFRPH